MAIDNKNVIDAISTDKEGNIALTISDHLVWDKQNEHLVILQDKVNSYLDFLTSGQIYNDYPDAKDKKIYILLITKYLPSTDGKAFLKILKESLTKYGYDFKYLQLNE